MDDLISRQALCQYALNQKNKSVTPNDIMRFPSAEPKTGEWIYKNDLKEFFCSECGCPSLTHDDVYIYEMDLPNYCPNCGSYNGGGEEK